MDTQSTNPFKALLRESAKRELERLTTSRSGIDQGQRALQQTQGRDPVKAQALEDVSLTAQQAMMEALKRQQQTVQATQEGFPIGTGGIDQMATGQAFSGNVGPFAITQRFGVHNPGIEVFSQGGINTGLDIGTPAGTPLSAPAGRWQVTDVFTGAKGKGRIGDATNKGYGNSVVLTNLDTGEQIRTSHLSGANVLRGQMLTPGMVFGSTGATGNVTGAHLDLEYRNAQGKLADPMTSPYWRQLLAGRRGN